MKHIDYKDATEKVNAFSKNKLNPKPSLKFDIDFKMSDKKSKTSFKANPANTANSSDCSYVP